MTIETNIPLAKKRRAPRTGTIAEGIRELMKAPVGASVFFDTNKSTPARQAYLIGGAGWYSYRIEGTGMRVYKTAHPSDWEVEK